MSGRLESYRTMHAFYSNEKNFLRICDEINGIP